MSDNLVEQEQNRTRIRNPLGVDFTHTWGGKPITLPGDGKWYTFNTVLAKHLAKHLFSFIYNRYHDEQVAALKAKGMEQEAKKYRVPEPVQTKMRFMITGVLQEGDVVEGDVEDNLNIDEIKGELKKVEKMGAKDNLSVSVTSLVNEASVKALEADKAGRARSRGTAKVGAGDEVLEEPAEELDTTAVPADEPVESPKETAEEVSEPAEPATEEKPSEDEGFEPESLEELDE